MCSPKSSPYWKSNSSWPRLLGRHRSVRPSLLARAPGCPSRTARRRARRPPAASTPALDGLLHALEDQLLGVGDRRRSARASDRPRSRTSSSGTTLGGRRPGCRACRRSRAAIVRYPVVSRFACRASYSTRPHGAEVQRPRVHGRHRGGADDPRRRDARAGQRDRASARGLRRRRRDQAGADGVRARDLDRPVRGHCARPARQLRALRRQVSRHRRREGAARSARPARIRSRAGRTSGSPRAPRYRDLVDALRFVARQEIIFGLHVHVGLDDPDKAIHVANGMRVHVPILLALSANSPFWRARRRPGCASTRMPIFRAFPRVGIPPYYEDWDDYEQPDRLHGRGRRDGGLHVALVRRPPAPELRHGRDPGDGRADPRRAHARRSRR